MLGSGPCNNAYAIHTVLTDNGMAFADLPKNRGRYPAVEAMFGGHIFDRVCKQHGIQHKLTKPYHPWTNGQAERMNRTVKDATIKAFHYPDLDSLKAHVLAFVSAYNFAKHLKAIRWKTPFEAVSHAWTATPDIFLHTLKTELVHHQTYRTRDEAKRDLFSYVEGSYNRQRLHSALDHRTPDQAEQQASVTRPRKPWRISRGSLIQAARPTRACPGRR